MIYAIISGINEKDCRFMRQPSLYLPAEIEKYIFETKEEKTREERLAACELLSASLEKIFGVKNWSIKKNEYGKPILVINGKQNDLYMNISHSAPTVAVVLSDEGEIGVDLQSEISAERESRLKKRFFNFDIATTENFSVSYILFDREKGFTEPVVCPAEQIGYTDKWAVCEAVMKCDGRGFSSLPEFEKIQRNMDITVKRLLLNGVLYSLSIAKKRVVM